MLRKIKSLHSPVQTQDGAGVSLKRYFPVPHFGDIDPFLLLDHFGSDQTGHFIAGFPMHPHRGIETVTYMLDGRIKHKDSTGRSGVIGAGDVQWMSAGRGILHEEMPEFADGKLDGFQLWVNLPAKDKMKPAEYQEYASKNIPIFTQNGHLIRLISGTLLGQQGAVKQCSSAPIYADIHLKPGQLTFTLPKAYNAFITVYNGALSLVSATNQAQTITAPQLAVLDDGDELRLECLHSTRLLLVAGKPNNEPIVRSGPFVMNTKEEIIQTWQEISDGQFPPPSEQQTRA